MKFFGNKKKEEKPSGNSSDEQLVIDLISKIIENKNVELKPETRLTDLGFDSIKYINLMFAFEELVDIDVEQLAQQVDITSVVTIQDVISIYRSLN